MKLSNTNLFKIYLTKDKNYIDKYVFMKDEQFDYKKHYDVALVLGCSNYDILYKRVDAALDLYNKKVVNKILLSGGVGILSKNRTKKEAIVMKEYLLSKGVIEKDIFVESESKNTVSNMKNSLEIINELFNKKINIILVTSSFHMKRSKAILENMCDHNIYAYSINDGLCDKDIWNNNKVSRKYIKHERVLLYFYVKKGTIKDMEI